MTPEVLRSRRDPVRTPLSVTWTTNPETAPIAPRPPRGRPRVPWRWMPGSPAPNQYFWCHHSVSLSTLTLLWLKERNVEAQWEAEKKSLRRVTAAILHQECRRARSQHPKAMIILQQVASIVESLHIQEQGSLQTNSSNPMNSSQVREDVSSIPRAPTRGRHTFFLVMHSQYDRP